MVGEVWSSGWAFHWQISNVGAPYDPSPNPLCPTSLCVGRISFHVLGFIGAVGAGLQLRRFSPGFMLLKALHDCTNYSPTYLNPPTSPLPLGICLLIPSHPIWCSHNFPQRIRMEPLVIPTRRIIRVRGKVIINRP